MKMLICGDLINLSKLLWSNETNRFEFLLFYLSLRHYIFPADSIEPPLEIVEFCGIRMMAPRGGLEFQKIHYGNDWYTKKEAQRLSKFRNLD